MTEGPNNPLEDFSGEQGKNPALTGEESVGICPPTPGGLAGIDGCIGVCDSHLDSLIYGCLILHLKMVVQIM